MDPDDDDELSLAGRGTHNHPMDVSFPFSGRWGPTPQQALLPGVGILSGGGHYVL